MHKLKKVLIVAVILICSLNIISARGINNAVKLTEILTESKDKDIKSLLANREIDSLTRIIEDVNEEAEETNILAGTAQTQLQSKVKKYIEPLRAEMNLEIAKRNENQRLVKREAELTNAYWQVYLTQLVNEKAEIELKIAKNNYEAAKIKLNKGSISGYDLSAERYNYEQKQLNAIDCSNKHKKALFYLNELLEKELTTIIIVDDSLTLKIPTNWDVDINTSYKTALLENEEIYRVSKEAEFAAMKLQYAGEEFKSTSDEYLDVVADKERADYNYLSSKNSLYMSIVSDSNFILIGLENYDLLNLRLEMEQSSMRATEIKLSKGHASNNDYLQSKVNVLNAKYQLQSLVAELNYSYQNFNIKYLLKTN